MDSPPELGLNGRSTLAQCLAAETSRISDQFWGGGASSDRLWVAGAAPFASLRGLRARERTARGLRAAGELQH
jgi:hypothetical protein